MPPANLSWHRAPALTQLVDPSVAAAWDRLTTDCGDLPFMSAAAAEQALRCFGSGQEQLLQARRGGRTVAMFILAQQGFGRWQTFQPSQMPLGVWVAAAGEDLPSLCDSLIRALGLCAVLSITQVDERLHPMQADRPTSLHAPYISTGWVDVAGSFDDYWAARGKNLRQNMRKQRNKLAADGVATTMRVSDAPDQMAAAVQRYGELESAGWKSDRGTAISPDNQQGRFYTGLLEQAARKGEAVVYEYLFDDRPVAINLCLRRAGTLVVLKTTYDESIKSLSPAFLLREEELRQIFEHRQFQRIEYYGKLMDWHTKLTDNKRQIYHLTWYRWAWVKGLALSRRQATADIATAPPAADTAASEVPTPSPTA